MSHTAHTYIISHLYILLFTVLCLLSLPSTTHRKVIRCCHPDKHMSLPPRSAAFLELQKVFTVLSEAYNSFKASSRP